MRRSKKSYLYLDSRKVEAGIEVGKEKTIDYGGHSYKYRVDKYTMYKDYYALVVVGGPHQIRATTTCKKSGIKSKLKAIILTLKHK
jgi:hypothetical protein